MSREKAEEKIEDVLARFLKNIEYDHKTKQFVVKDVRLLHEAERVLEALKRPLC